MRVIDSQGAERFVGVRCNDDSVLARLRERFGTAVVDDVEALTGGQAVTANLSLKVGATMPGRRLAHMVYRRGHEIFTTFDLDRAIDAVAASLHTFPRLPDGLVELHGVVLERNGAATLLVPDVREALDALHRQVAAAGFRRLLQQPVWADPSTGELVLQEGGPSAPVQRRVPIERLVVVSRDAVDHDTPVGRVTHAAWLIVGKSRFSYATPQDVEALLQLVQRVPYMRLRTLDRKEVVDAICAL